MNKISDSQKAIQRALNSKPTKMTKAQAQRILQASGIFDKNNNISKKYKGIFVKVDK